MMLILGVDEAGKGPVIGSMFVAGVVFSEEDIFDLAACGVKDSKLLSPTRRESMERKILSIARESFVLEVTAQQIDDLRMVMSMNEIMVRAHSRVVSRLQADRAILDAADVNAERFAQRVREVSGKPIDILAEHNADRKHIVVAAASIIAKVARDRSIRDLEAALGRPLGSGYPSDPATVRFLKEWIEENGDLPSFVRKSWSTAQRLKASSV
ncbi:MAG: ribonuclease HII [Methanothrix sp.]|jgi:ribonuclease HII|uniref:Ribonuclease HII n=1 Tax=Methanothrix thermoacetophila (strain DSM 6194 / JCM 14653 / NBRC 101360 / PT) TaxID=349307 RepID=RNH2_METTP|nr:MULTISPECIES: ribonuclease HII [Methanothrix]A0B796.1 RecName: Full=Ribonuclease HII; Short=RNase HII [Methanothrix thermoacetophila PT]ABK14570.1 RNase HII [Methanothrix thermoacetophila PT]MBC7079431.1 ribonuclease HII [Methanothrix sp.]NPU87406.1 ribonuclease HII [Methanothrix sp.]